jgi:hypothetical protein
LKNKAETKKAGRGETKEGDKKVCPHCKKEIVEVMPGWGGKRREECGCTKF